MRISKVFGAALLAYAAAAGAQESGQPLTLEECIRRAQAAGSAAGVARQQVEIARLGTVQARAAFLPQAAVGIGQNYNSPSRTDRSTFSFIALNAIREYVSLGNVALDVDTSGRLRAQLARARAEQEIAAGGLVLSQRDLKRAVAASFYRVLLARHLATATRDVLGEARTFEKRTRLLAQNGEAAQADVVKAAAQAAAFEQAVNEADLEARLANHELAAFWTTDVETALPLADSLEAPLPQPEPQAGALYLRRPEFRIFDAQRRGFQADARRARADLLPQLSLVTQYGFDSTHFSFADRGYATFAHLHIPVFDWFRARSAQRQFQAQARQVEIQKDIAGRTFSKEYRDALARVELLYAQIATMETQVSLSRDNLRLSRIRYEGGEGPALEVVAAQGQLAQALSGYFTSKARYLNARADLEVTSGR